MTPPRRIAIVGPPGSGKSTLARQVRSRLALPIVHLDALHHAPGWTKRPTADFRADVAAAVAQPHWVIDGNYSSASEQRFALADVILFLDLPRRVTIPRLIRRIATGYGRVRIDSAPGCRERLDWPFLLYAWRWRDAVRPRLLIGLREHEKKAVIFSDQRSIDAYVATLTPPVRAAGP